MSCARVLAFATAYTYYMSYMFFVRVLLFAVFLPLYVCSAVLSVVLMLQAVLFVVLTSAVVLFVVLTSSVVLCAAVAVEQLKLTPVKRHHSTGDMLDDQAANHEHDDVKLRMRRFKPRRPKSDGSFIVEGFIPRRASSFGVSRLSLLSQLTSSIQLRGESAVSALSAHVKNPASG